MGIQQIMLSQRVFGNRTDHLLNAYLGNKLGTRSRRGLKYRRLGTGQRTMGGWEDVSDFASRLITYGTNALGTKGLTGAMVCRWLSVEQRILIKRLSTAAPGKNGKS